MRKRSPLAVFVLSIVTFGIYDIYWLVTTKKVLNRETRIRIPTIWLLFLPVLLLIILVPLTVLLPLLASSGTHSSAAATVGTSLFLIIFQMIIVLAVLPISFYWFFKYSKAVNEYTRGAMNTGVTFLLLWLLHLIGVALVQDAFNDAAEQLQRLDQNLHSASPAQYPQPAMAQPYVPPAVPYTPQPQQPTAPPVGHYPQQAPSASPSVGMPRGPQPPIQRRNYF